MTEKQLQMTVLNLAKLQGWDLCYHTFNSKRSAPGFPDLVLVRPPRVIFAELKTTTGALRPEQREWLTALDQCSEGVEVYVWRPSDLQDVAATLVRQYAPPVTA